MKTISGFTLIELVVVIVILAVLAGIALPKFADLSAEARMVMVETFEDSLRSSVEAANGKAQLNGTNLNAANQFIDWNNDGDNSDGNGVDLRLDFGYPEQTANGIDLLITELGDFTVANGGGLRQFRLNGMATCMVSYLAPTAAGEDGVVAVDISGC